MSVCVPVCVCLCVCGGVQILVSAPGVCLEWNRMADFDDGGAPAVAPGVPHDGWQHAVVACGGFGAVSAALRSGSALPAVVAGEEGAGISCRAWMQVRTCARVCWGR